MASTIRGSDNFDSAGINALRAFVHFNGTGTVAIKASENVSSITDNGVGTYVANFTNALADADYVVSGFVSDDNTASSWVGFNQVTQGAPTITTCPVSVYAVAGLADRAYVELAIFR